MKTFRMVICMLLYWHAQMLSGQTLEYHQMAAQNADAACIIVRDTSKVMDIIRWHIVRQIDTTKVGLLQGAIGPIVYDGFTTQRFMFQLSRLYLSATEQNTLGNQLGPTFQIAQPNIAQLKNALHTLSVAGGNYAAALGVINNFQINLTSIFEGDDVNNRVNMTQYVIDLAEAAAPADKANYNLIESIKEVVVIDAGRRGTGPVYLARYLRKQGVGNLIHQFILSHNHDDHYGGFRKLASELSPLTINTAYESGYAYLEPEAFSKAFKVDYREPMKDALDFSNLTALEAIEGFRGGSPSDKRKVPMPGTTINLPNNVNMYCVASNSFVIGDPNFNKESKRGGKNQNDYSLSWVVTYGNFKFYTGGDLSGYGMFKEKTKSFCTNYNDIESSLIASLPNAAKAPFMGGSGHVCAFKVGHHGSRCSSNSDFLNGLNARVAIIPNGVDNKHANPDKETFERLVGATGGPAIYCVGLMQTLARKRIFFPYRDYVQKNNLLNTRVFVTGNTAIVVDDLKNSALQTRLMVKWDGETNLDAAEDPAKFAQLYTPSAKGKRFVTCNHQ